MQRLIDAGLFGQGLVLVKTPEMVRRYNDCLKQLGLEETALPSFHIDGIGWSPEIAQEKGSPMYLSHGPANQLAIILTPDQRFKPIYFPFTSFDRLLMAGFFQRFETAIADITITNGVCLDIDQELSGFEDPTDLLLVDQVIVRAMADDLSQAAKEQKELVAKYQAEEMAWADPVLRQQLIDSIKQYGDLRFRQVEISDWPFELRSFYNLAFGGVFIFRDTEDGDFMVIEDMSLAKKTKTRKTPIFGLDDKGLVKKLQDSELVAADMEFYCEHPEIIGEKLDCLLIDLIAEKDPEINFLDLNAAQKKGWIRRLGDKVPKLYHDLERLLRQLNSKELPDNKKLSEDVKLLLLHPNPELAEDIQEVVGRLLARLQPWRLLICFENDKNLFYQRYQNWSEAKKLWAIEVIKNSYQPKMKVLKDLPTSQDL